MEKQTAQVNGIELAYTDFGGAGVPLLLMPGLTSNRHAFGGLVRTGLGERVRVIAVDMRGRGESDKPATGYSMADHAKDIIALLDVLGIEEVVIGGHSFGGMMSWYIAAHYPQRVKACVVIDAGLEVADPSVVDKIRPSLERLGVPIPSWEVFLNAIKATPYFDDGWWHADAEAFYRADMVTLTDGQVRSSVSKEAIAQVIEHILVLDWREILGRVQQPCLLIHSPNAIGKEKQIPPVLSQKGADDTVKVLAHCQYVPTSGHHVTMIWGQHAQRITEAIVYFLNNL